MRHCIDQHLLLFLIEIREFKLLVVHDVSLKVKTITFLNLYKKSTHLTMEADLDPPLNMVRLGVGTGAHNEPVVPACSDRLDSDSHFDEK